MVARWTSDYRAINVSSLPAVIVAIVVDRIAIIRQLAVYIWVAFDENIFEI